MPIAKPSIPGELDYIPPSLALIPKTALVNNRLSDSTALFYQNENYRKYHELAFNYTLLLKVTKGEVLTDTEIKKLKK